LLLYPSIHTLDVYVSLFLFLSLSHPLSHAPALTLLRCLSPRPQSLTHIYTHTFSLPATGTQGDLGLSFALVFSFTLAVTRLLFLLLAQFLSLSLSLALSRSLLLSLALSYSLLLSLALSRSLSRALSLFSARSVFFPQILQCK